MPATDTRSPAVTALAPWQGGGFWINISGKRAMWFSCIGQQGTTDGDETGMALVWKSMDMTITAEPGRRRVVVTHGRRWPTIPELAAIQNVFSDIKARPVIFLPTTLNYRDGVSIWSL